MLFRSDVRDFQSHRRNLGNDMQTDRNLLFGVLAFQDEYIDLAQLAAICREWVADKSRSIPQLLVERQWLSEQARDELERKVERKLKRFVGDAHATLGAVADGAVRDVLKQVNDPDISESLSSWPDGREGVGSLFQPASRDDRGMAGEGRPEKDSRPLHFPWN